MSIQLFTFFDIKQNSNILLNQLQKLIIVLL